MKQFNKSSDLTNPKKMERLFKWIQEDLTIKSFSKTQKQIIHDVMTLADCLHRKSRNNSSAAAKRFKSENIQIIYNFKTETMEFSCSSRGALINEKNLFIKPFNPDLVESQIERVHLLTINLESLLQRMTDSEVNEIFMEKERNPQNRDYCEQRYLAFKK